MPLASLQIHPAESLRRHTLGLHSISLAKILHLVFQQLVCRGVTDRHPPQQETWRQFQSKMLFLDAVQHFCV